MNYSKWLSITLCYNHPMKNNGKQSENSQKNQQQKFLSQNKNQTHKDTKTVNSKFDVNKDPLKIIPIGGTTTVQKNMYIYESGNDIIVIDCGIGFPDLETPGVDIIIPDFSYILNNRDRVRGIVITHGHEDHRSSLPYLLREHKFDIYAMPFVKKLIEKALEEYTDIDNVNIREINPDQSFRLGRFVLHPFRVNHSIPDTLGFAIDTPQGRIFHNTDFKFDWTPVMDKPFEVQKAAKFASEPKEGVLALLSDCLGSTSDGYATSEKYIQKAFEEILEKEKGKQVFITTVSSNISRIYQAIEASLKYGRKVVISGRSLRNTIEVARAEGYIDFLEENFVDENKAYKYNQSELTYIITGSYGQRNAGLARVAYDDHKYIALEDDAVIIFSADPIPTSVMLVNALIDQLYSRGATVYYSEIQDNLHVSGHGIRGDLTLLAQIVKPKYFIPIGGNIKHMRAYANLMQEQGFDKNSVFQLLDGQPVIFENGKARVGEQLKLRDVYVDGSLVGDVGANILSERIQMGTGGIVVVPIVGEKISIITKGFVFEKMSKDLLQEAETVVKNRLKELRKESQEIAKDKKSKKGGLDKKVIEQKIERTLSKYFMKKTGREPLVFVSLLE